MNVAHYSLLTIAPIIERRDLVVVGIVVLAAGEWRVQMTRDHRKVHAIDPNFSELTLEKSADMLKLVAKGFQSIAEYRAFLSTMQGAITVDPFEGGFAYETEVEYNEQIQQIFAESVDAPAARSMRRERGVERSRLRFKLKKHFEERGLLGTAGDIDKHKVVPKFPIQPDQGLYAEFALKNAVMHITETVDFTTSVGAYTAKKYEAQAKCLILKAATEECGADTKKYVIINGGAERNAKRALSLLSANAQLFHIESASDMATYTEAIETAAGHAGLQIAQGLQ